MVYLITYDLNKPGQDYSDLYEAIALLGEGIHPLSSVWLVDTRLTPAKAVSDRLQSHIDGSDRLLVVAFTRDYWGWLPKDAWDWIGQHV